MQKIKAIDFIQKREQIQQEAERFVRDYLQTYHIEVRGVYIQNVVFPDEVTKVQQQREIADQQKAMFAAQQEAQASRVALERQRGEADMQADLVKAQVTVDIERSNAEAVKARAAGRAGEITTVAKAEAEKIEVTTAAEAKGIKAKGQSQAEVYDLQAKAIGPERAAAVAVAHELAEGGVNITPQTVVGGSDLGLLGGAMTGVLAKALADKRTDGQRPEDIVVASTAVPDTPASIVNEA